MVKPKKKILRKISSWLSERVKDHDKFSTPILLRYKGDTEFKTGIGGITSIWLLIFLLVYAALLIKQMINRESRDNIFLNCFK